MGKAARLIAGEGHVHRSNEGSTEREGHRQTYIMSYKQKILNIKGKGRKYIITKREREDVA